MNNAKTYGDNDFLIPWKPIPDTKRLTKIAGEISNDSFSANFALLNLTSFQVLEFLDSIKTSKGLRLKDLLLGLECSHKLIKKYTFVQLNAMLHFILLKLFLPYLWA